MADQIDNPQGKARRGIITNPLRAAVLAATYRDEIQFPRQRAIPLTLLPRPLLAAVLLALGAVGRLVGYRAVPSGRSRARR